MTSRKQQSSGSSQKARALFSALWRWLPPVAWMGLIFYLSAQPDLPHPSMGWLGWVINSAAHTFVFAVLAILWARALGQGLRSWFVAVTLTVLYALSDEFHQSFVPGRHADPLDLAFDALGAALGLAGWICLQRRISISPKSRS